MNRTDTNWQFDLKIYNKIDCVGNVPLKKTLYSRTGIKSEQWNLKLLDLMRCWAISSITCCSTLLAWAWTIVRYICCVNDSYISYTFAKQFAVSLKRYWRRTKKKKLFLNSQSQLGDLLHYLFWKTHEMKWRKKQQRWWFFVAVIAKTHAYISKLLHAVPEWVEITHHKHWFYEIIEFWMRTTKAWRRKKSSAVQFGENLKDTKK